nr:MAG: YopX protein [Bacteriophage sp.]
MRETNFRAWVKWDKRMLPVKSIIFETNRVSVRLRERFWISTEFNEIELMESTGLHDIHGKEVFEGDIVKIPEDYDKFGRNAGEILKVAFNNGCFRLKRPNSKGRGFYFEDDNTVEVIGNIYENPELLGE